MAENFPSPQVAVVYLAYLPYGPEPVERFLASYRKHPAGRDHKLIVALKGQPLGDVPAMEAQTTWVPDEGLDLSSYLWLARKTKAERYCFLNTSSVILAEGWLEKLDRHLCNGAGIVGATGSWGKARRRDRHPNPHVRTNAFMLERDLMLSLDWQEPIMCKDDAYETEHGLRSITAQVRARGLDALVVGRDGEAFSPGRWPESKTFWNGEQENLLIADNATRKWSETENGPARRYLYRFAWLSL